MSNLGGFISKIKENLEYKLHQLLVFFKLEDEILFICPSDENILENFVLKILEIEDELGYKSYFVEFFLESGAKQEIKEILKRNKIIVKISEHHYEILKNNYFEKDVKEYFRYGNKWDSML